MRMSESPVGREIIEDIKNSSPYCLIGQNDNMGSQQEVRLLNEVSARSILFIKKQTKMRIGLN